MLYKTFCADVSEIVFEFCKSVDNNVGDVVTKF